MPLNKRRSPFLVVLHHPATWILIACLPALYIYISRVLIPDYATDTLSYHLFNGMRGALQPFVPFLQTEFYPVGIANIAPGYDAVQFFVRSLLGYRLGTVLSLLASVGSLVVLYKILALVLQEQKKKFHAGWGIVLVNAAIILEWYFQLATYFVDILNAFFVLLLFYIVLRRIARAGRVTWKYWVLVWLAVGTLLALKLTNAGLLLPLAVLLIWQAWVRRSSGKRFVLLGIVAAIVALIPLLPGWVQNIALTHNPLFPFYNNVFQSDYYPSSNFSDTNFGGQGLIERAFWPVASLGQQVRLGEPHHIYDDYKIPLYWLCAIGLALLGTLKWVRLGKTQKVVLYYFLATLFCSGLLFGINRYILSSLLIGGLVVAIIFSAKYRIPKVRSKKVAYIVAGLLCFLLAIENGRILQFNLTYDMSWRPPLHQAAQVHADQLKHLFDTQLDLTPAQKNTVMQADILLNCTTNVAGPLSLLPGASDKPVVNIISAGLPQYADMADNPAYRQMVKSRLSIQKDTYTWVSLVSPELATDKACSQNIHSRGGEVTDATTIDTFMGYNGLTFVLLSGWIPL